jgi:hypothetical protein
MSRPFGRDKAMRDGTRVIKEEEAFRNVGHVG